MRPSLLTLLAVLVALVGCGSSDQAKDTASPATEQPQPASPTSTESSDDDDSVAAPDFVVLAEASSGDSVEIVGRFSAATTPEESDADPAAIEACGLIGPDRALVTRLDLEATVTSGLPANVSLAQFSRDSAYSGYLQFYLVGYTDGPACGDVIDLGELQPGETRNLTIWVLFDSAVTPNDPDPSPATLGRGTLMSTPVVDISGTILSTISEDRTGGTLKVGGRRVRTCVGVTISTAGTVPRSIKDLSGNTVRCKPVPDPR